MVIQNSNCIIYRNDLSLYFLFSYKNLKLVSRCNEMCSFLNKLHNLGLGMEAHIYNSSYSEKEIQRIAVPVKKVKPGAKNS